MKILIIYCFLLFQIQFPEIISNTDDGEKYESIIFNLFNGKKTFLIAYTTESYWWSNKKDYQVIAYDENGWKKIHVRSKRNKDGKWSKPKVSHKSVNSKQAEKLITELTEISFWKLESDSLNITKTLNGDGTTSKFSLSDGVNYKVEILQKNNFRIIECYEPEYFLSKMPEIKERKTFIQGKAIIESLFKK